MPYFFLVAFFLATFFFATFFLAAFFATFFFTTFFLAAFFVAIRFLPCFMTFSDATLFLSLPFYNFIFRTQMVGDYCILSFRYFNHTRYCMSRKKIDILKKRCSFSLFIKISFSYSSAKKKNFVRLLRRASTSFSALDSKRMTRLT